MSKHTPETKRSLRRAINLLEVFRNFDQDMPMGLAISLLLIADNEENERGLSVTELSGRGGFALSSASRYTQALGTMNRHCQPGFDLVSDRIDPMERRRKVLRLTERGRRTILDVAAAIDA